MQINFKPENVLFIFAVLLVVVLVGNPIFWLLWGSISEDGGITLDHWTKAYANSEITEAVLNTLLVCGFTAIVATLIGVVLAFISVRTDTPFRKTFIMISLVPIIVTPLLGAMAWNILGNKQNGLINTISQSLGFGIIIDIESFYGLILVMVIYTTPFVFLIVSNGLQRQDAELEEIARICGSGKLRMIWSVTLRLVRPAIIAGMLLAFILSAEMFGVHAVLGIPAGISLLTTEIYRVMSIPPIDLHQGTVLAAILLAIMGIAMYMQMKSHGLGTYSTVKQDAMPKIIRIGRWKYAALAFVSVYFILSVILPTFVLLIRSLKPYVFGNNSSLHDLFSGWSLQSYYSVFGYDLAVRAFTNSLLLSLLAAFIAVIVAMIMAYIIVKTRMRGKNVLLMLCMTPIAISGMVLGVGMLWAYSRLIPLYGTIFILLIAYIIRGLPYGTQSILPSFMQVHKEWEESAAVCGSSWTKRFVRIVFPLIRLDLLAAFIFVFLLSFRDIGTSILLFSYGNEVVGVLLFNLWSEGLISQMSAVAILTLIAAFLVLAIVQRAYKRKDSGFQGTTNVGS